ncbi:hypothetical protein B4090_2242 [Bacillus licheniformis]|nr:hypothetical protein B4090_2242 [Bacillus licheniformis]
MRVKALIFTAGSGKIGFLKQDCSERRLVKTYGTEFEKNVPYCNRELKFVEGV